uniref:Acyl-CoA thioesterase-like C-terminal domain-containing protein n=1 Tax=Pristionchus pacificus TaxID=54126 RepID=A0A8R1YSY1_PRIPA
MDSASLPVSNVFNLVKGGESVMRADPPHAGGPTGVARAYGGQLVSQAANSFIILNPHIVPHTVNYKFIAPGKLFYFITQHRAHYVKTTIPLHYKVHSYEKCNVASVSVYQSDKLIGMCHIQFSKSADFLDSSPITSPEYGPHWDFPPVLEVVEKMDGATRFVLENMANLPLEIRPVESPMSLLTDKDRTSFWAKLKPVLGDAKPSDGLVAALFISDFAILLVAGEIYRRAEIMITGASSLHHSVWIHEANLDPLSWYLTVTECDVMSYGRVRLESRILNENRKCVMTVIQEGYMQRANRDFDAGMDSQPETYFNYFNLVRVDGLTVRSDPPHSAAYTADRAFGGLIVSQAVNSFLSIYPARSPHTINYKFIAAVNPSIPLHFKLNPFEDCSVLRVFVYQGDKHVGSCHIQFTNKPDLLDSAQLTCPEYGTPADNSARQQSRITRNVMTIYHVITNKFMITMVDKIPLELRPVESPLCPLSEKERCSYWMRLKPQLQDIVKPTDGLVVLHFISDIAILQVAEEIYLKARIKMEMAASLHHSVWIHEENLDPFCWYLTICECEVIFHGRARLETRIFNESRKCVMTVLQEGYIQRQAYHQTMSLVNSALPPFANLFNLIKVDDSIMRTTACCGCSRQGLRRADRITGYQLVLHDKSATLKMTVAMHYKVDRLEGCNIATVSGYQGDKLVGKGHIQFTTAPDFLDSSSIICPDYGPPSDYPELHEIAKVLTGPRGIATKVMADLPLDIRFVDSPLFQRSNTDRASYWLKLKDVVGGAKPIDGRPALLFMSDFSILQVAGDIYEKSKLKFSSISSLHHSVWIHEANLDPLAWYLTVTECTTISHGRPRVESHIFNESRKCVMTVIQEGYLQRVHDQESPRL